MSEVKFDHIVLGVRARHDSARPHPVENPAWANAEHDIGIMLDAYDTLSATCARLERELGDVKRNRQAMIDLFNEQKPNLLALQAERDALRARVEDSELSLRAYDTGMTSEYWLRHAPLSSTSAALQRTPERGAEAPLPTFGTANSAVCPRCKTSPFVMIPRMGISHLCPDGKPPHDPSPFGATDQPIAVRPFKVGDRVKFKHDNGGHVLTITELTDKGFKYTNEPYCIHPLMGMVHGGETFDESYYALIDSPAHQTDEGPTK